jgi:hypothetical protein
MLDELAFDQSAPMECEKQQQEKGSNTSWISRVVVLAFVS